MRANDDKEKIADEFLKTYNFGAQFRPKILKILRKETEAFANDVKSSVSSDQSPPRIRFDKDTRVYAVSNSFDETDRRQPRLHTERVLSSDNLTSENIIENRDDINIAERNNTNGKSSILDFPGIVTDEDKRENTIPVVDISAVLEAQRLADQRAHQLELEADRLRKLEIEAIERIRLLEVETAEKLRMSALEAERVRISEIEAANEIRLLELNAEHIRLEQLAKDRIQQAEEAAAQRILFMELEAAERIRRAELQAEAIRRSELESASAEHARSHKLEIETTLRVELGSLEQVRVVQETPRLDEVEYDPLERIRVLESEAIDRIHESNLKVENLRQKQIEIIQRNFNEKVHPLDTEVVEIVTVNAGDQCIQKEATGYADTLSVDKAQNHDDLIPLKCNKTEGGVAIADIQSFEELFYNNAKAKWNRSDDDKGTLDHSFSATSEITINVSAIQQNNRFSPAVYSREFQVSASNRKFMGKLGNTDNKMVAHRDIYDRLYKYASVKREHLKHIKDHLDAQWLSYE